MVPAFAKPQCERRLHEEIDSVLEGRVPGFEDLPRLTYTEMVFAEALRLYPPAWAIGRKAKDDFELAGTRIAGQSICILSPYVVHRDARWYPDPERFDPERWTPEARESRPKFSYFPFGGGSRVCIGERFAWMEGILTLAAVGAEMETAASAGSARRTAAVDHAADQIRHADDGRAALAGIELKDQFTEHRAGRRAVASHDLQREANQFIFFRLRHVPDSGLR